MGARRTLNLALAVLAAALGAYLFLLPQPTDDDGSRIPLSDIDPGSVTRIELRREGAVPIELESRGQQWWLRAPLDFPADGFKAASLVSMLQAPARPIAGAGGDLSAYGLDPPLELARFDDTLLRVGATESVSGKRYVQRGDRVLLVEDAWYTHLFASPQRWADPRPLAPHDSLQGIELPPRRWQREGERWLLRAPADGNDGGDGARIADAWTRARALAVDAVDPGLPWHPGPELHTGDTPGERLRFQVAESGRMVFLARESPPLQYQFTRAQAALLLGTAPAAAAPPARDRERN